MVTQISSKRTVWIVVPEPDDQVSSYPHLTLNGKHDFQNSNGYKGSIPDNVVAIINPEYAKEIVEYLTGLVQVNL